MNTNPYSLSSQEAEVLSFLNQSPSIAVLIGKASARLHTIMKSFVMQRLSEGNTCIIRTSDIQQITSILKEWNLSDFALHLKKDTHLSINTFPTTTLPDRSATIEAIKSNIKYLKLVERLKEYQTTYNEKIFGEYSRNKLCELLYLSKIKSNRRQLDLKLSTENFELNDEEFWRQRNKIDKAAKHYKSSYQYLQASDPFTTAVYMDLYQPEKHASILKSLNEFLIEAEAVDSAYEKEFLRIYEQLHERYRNHYDELTRIVQDLEIQVAYYEIECELSPKTSPFKSKSNLLEKQKKEVRSHYEMLKTTLQKERLFKINCPENTPDIDPHTLNRFLSDLQLLLKKGQQIIKKAIADQLEILNAINYDAPALKNIQRKQEELITSLNRSNIFKVKSQNLSISSWNSSKFIKELITQIRKAKLFLEANPNYAIYRSFECALTSKTQSVINALKTNKQNEWVDIFETWYFNALFEKYHLNSSLNIDLQHAKLEDHKSENNQYEFSRIHNVFSALREKNASLKTKLGKNGKNWKAAFLSDPDGFKASFPILVCDEAFFASELDHLNYDFLVCHKNTDIPSNLFTSTHFKATFCLSIDTIAAKQKEDIANSQNYLYKEYFQIKSKTIESLMLSERNFTDKLQLGRYLKYVLQESKFEKMFFSAKDFSIISCMSSFCSKLLELELEEARIKSLRYTHLDSGIVEDIMIKEDNSKYLLIQDGFLHPELDIEWQITTLRNIRQAGIKVINISSSLLVQNEQFPSLLTLANISEITTVNKKAVLNET